MAERWQDVFRVEPTQPPPCRVGPRVCNGYVNCCRCPRCLERAEQVRRYGFTPDGKIAEPPRSLQPWEPRPSRNAA